MLTVSVQEYDIADVRAVFGDRVRNMIGRTDSAATDEIGAAVRSNRTTTNSARRELRP
jgi:hypothetical protein